MNNYKIIDQTPKNPMVSVAMLAYNHEKFIVQAIESVLMQQVEFSIQIVIAEDCSPDNTRNIVLDYQRKYPDKIKLILQERNVGATLNNKTLLSNLSGKYIAALECDDYWLNPSKLQTQISFLESNKIYSLCAHNAFVRYEDSDTKEHLFNSLGKTQELLPKTVISEWIMPTASMIFRRQVIEDLPNWFSEIYCGDYTLALLSLNKGKIHFIDEPMSVYRVTLKGTSFSSSYAEKVLFVFEQHLKLMKLFNEFSNKKFEVIINNKIKRLNSEILFFKNRQVSNLNAFFKQPCFFVQKLKEKIVS